MPRVTLFGITFDSQLKSLRYLQLREMQERGEISDLQVRPRFVISVSPLTKRERRYTADFEYQRSADGAQVVEAIEPRRRKAKRWTRDFPRRVDLARTRYPDREFLVVPM